MFNFSLGLLKLKARSVYSKVVNLPFFFNQYFPQSLLDIELHLVIASILSFYICFHAVSSDLKEKKKAASLKK